MAASNENRVITLSKDADEAFNALENHDQGHLEVDEATNRRLLKKIDTHLMPVRQPFVSAPLTH
jgi:hypothetical protein